MSFCRGVRWPVLVAALCLSPWLRAADAPPSPFPADETRVVLGEINAMIRTGEESVDSFVLREATPDRMRRLLDSPYFATLTKVERENALVLAAKTGQLSFDSPGDLLARMTAWFPDLIKPAQTDRSRESGLRDILTYGPFRDTPADQAAFLLLWNCMPQIAWLRPGEYPLNRHSPQDSIAMAGEESARTMRGSATEFGFRQCLREMPGGAIYQLRQAERDRLFPAVAAVIRDRLETTLRRQACNGTGPDDCVWLLLLWADLQPNDPALREALRRLAPVAGLRVWPPRSDPGPVSFAWNHAVSAEANTAWRTGAFLRAQLASVAAHPEAWDDAERREALRQALRFSRQWRSVTQGSTRYDLARDGLANPWAAFADGLLTRDDVRGVLREEVLATDAASCREWPGGDMSGAMVALLKLMRLQNGQSADCPEVPADYAALAAVSPVDREAMTRLLADSRAGQAHEHLLAALTQNGERCFRPPLPAGWTADVCRRWVSRPPELDAGARQALWREGTSRFRPRHFRLTPGDQGEDPDVWSARQPDWLVRVAQRGGAPSLHGLEALTQGLAQRALFVTDVRWWSAPRRARHVVELVFSGGVGQNTAPQSPTAHREAETAKAHRG